MRRFFLVINIKVGMIPTDFVFYNIHISSRNECSSFKPTLFIVVEKIVNPDFPLHCYICRIPETNNITLLCS